MIRILAVLAFLAIHQNAFADDPLIAADETSTANPPADTPAPSLGKDTAAPQAEAKPDPNVGVPSSPEAQPALPLSSIPGKTDKSPAHPVADNPNKDIYDEYYDYLDQEKARQKNEKDITQRSLFPHENGAWQLDMAYQYKAFSDYDFNRGNSLYSRTYGDTSGPSLALLVFPVRSLSFGRLGFGPTVAYYWSTFNFTGSAGDAIKDRSSKGSMYTYGVKAVYEFDYWLGQIIVPYAFASFDQVFVKGYGVIAGNGVKFADYPSYRSTSTAFGGGLHFNLNRVEPVVASRALVNVGIRKFYLTYNATQRVGEFGGLTHALGLTFEF